MPTFTFPPSDPSSSTTLPLPTFDVNNNNTSNNSGTSGDTAASTNSAATSDPGNATTAGAAAGADTDKGLNLIAQSDCLTCHKVEEKSIIYLATKLTIYVGNNILFI